MLANVHNHLLAETLLADGIATRWSRLGVLTSTPNLIWLLIVAMEVAYAMALHTSHKAISMYTFFAAYVVILTIIHGA